MNGGGGVLAWNGAGIEGADPLSERDSALRWLPLLSGLFPLKRRLEEERPQQPPR
ncbi:MAG: hypothetical protein M0Z95_13680 [Actinomycetota bacterium]|jgi:hypothetical protein|nr:hypothetical protein [Actinomycetota bacterium]